MLVKIRYYWWWRRRRQRYWTWIRGFYKRRRWLNIRFLWKHQRFRDKGVEFPLPLKEGTTAGAVVEYLEGVEEGHLGKEAEKVWGDPGEDLWAA
jgi:hypothetical protein